MNKYQTTWIIPSVLLTIVFAGFVAGCGRMYVDESLKSVPVENGSPVAPKPRDKTFTEFRTILSGFYGWYETLERDGVAVEKLQSPQPQLHCTVVSQIGNSNLKRTTVETTENGGTKTTTSEILADYFDPLTKKKILSDSIWIPSPGRYSVCDHLTVALFADRGVWSKTAMGVEYHFDDFVVKNKIGTRDELETVRFKIDFSISNVSETEVRVLVKTSDLNATWGSDFLLKKTP